MRSQEYVISLLIVLIVIPTFMPSILLQSNLTKYFLLILSYSCFTASGSSFLIGPLSVMLLHLSCLYRSSCEKVINHAPISCNNFQTCQKMEVKLLHCLPYLICHKCSYEFMSGSPSNVQVI